MGFFSSIKKAFKKTFNVATLGAFDDSAEKAAKKERERQEKLMKEQEEARKQEEEYKDQLEQDVQTLEGQEGPVKTGKPETTVDFSQAIKGDTDEDKDKLKKAFKSMR